MGEAMTTQRRTVSADRHDKAVIQRLRVPQPIGATVSVETIEEPGTRDVNPGDVVIKPVEKEQP